MKKNFLKGFALALGLVVVFNVNAFAAREEPSCNNLHNYEKTQLSQKKVRNFVGRYELTDNDLQKFQTLSADLLKKIKAEKAISNDTFDETVDKVVLNIGKDGHGKFCVLFDCKFYSGNGIDLYGKFCLALNISQVGDNTFSFDCDKFTNFKLSKKLINGKKCLIYTSDDSYFNKLVFKKVK